MAAKKQKPPKGKGAKKGLRSRVPTKRSINLTLIDENQISLPKAALGIVLIVALAVVFSKFLVMDRLTAMWQAENKASRMRQTVDQTKAALESIGNVEDTYAHYTTAGMTQAELGLVSRVEVLELVGTILPAGETALMPQEFESRLVELIRALNAGDKSVPDLPSFFAQFHDLFRRIVPTGYSVKSWSVSNNMLSVEIRGTSLQRLNRLARKLEEEGIVNSCAITTANRNGQKITDDAVHARFQIYLQQAPKEANAG